MTTRTTRRLWLLGLWLLVPWPLTVFSESFVPAVRYTILATATALVAVTEGAAGPVGMILGLMVGYALATTALCWLLAWAISRLLGRLPERRARLITFGCLGGGLLLALVFEPYRTTFGRAARGGLLAVLS
jgi:hypothetical protein